MRDRDGGAGGTSGVRFRTPAGIGCGLEGWFPHAMAGPEGATGGGPDRQAP